MRENPLISDISSQFDAQLQVQRQVEVADMATAEATEVTLAGRLLGSLGTELELRLMNGESLRGQVLRAAGTWLILELQRAQLLVWYRSLGAISGLDATPEWPTKVEERLTAAKILRDFAASRLEIQFVTHNSSLQGYIQRVGQDFVDIIDHGRQVTLPFDALLYVSCPR